MNRYLFLSAAFAALILVGFSFPPQPPSTAPPQSGTKTDDAAGVGLVDTTPSPIVVDDDQQAPPVTIQDIGKDEAWFFGTWELQTFTDAGEVSQCTGKKLTFNEDGSFAEDFSFATPDGNCFATGMNTGGWQLEMYDTPTGSGTRVVIDPGTGEGTTGITQNCTDWNTSRPSPGLGSMWFYDRGGQIVSLYDYERVDNEMRLYPLENGTSRASGTYYLYVRNYGEGN